MKTYSVQLKTGLLTYDILATGLPQAWSIAKRRYGKNAVSAVSEIAAIDPIELQMAIEKAGDENNGTWSTEGMNVMRQFSGSYTIAEIESLLRDMKRIQSELDRIAR